MFQTLMVHVTTMKMPLYLAVLLFMKIKDLLVHTSLTQELESWKSIVLKSINHPQVSSNMGDCFRFLSFVEYQID